MTETELISLFVVIQNTLQPFSFDRMKVEIWHKLLKDTPYALAESNLYRYLMDPDVKYPPTPGQLAKLPEAAAESRDVPDVRQTRLMLEAMNQVELEDGTRRPVNPVPMPAHLKERLEALVRDKSI